MGRACGMHGRGEECIQNFVQISGGKVWTGFIWLRIDTSGGLL